MLDVGWSELVVIGVVALVVIGPKDLPGAMRGLGDLIKKVRRMAGEFQGTFNEAMKEANLDGLKKDIADIRSAANLGNPMSAITKELSSISRIEPPKPPVSAPTAPPPTVASIEAMSGAAPAAPSSTPAVAIVEEDIPSAFAPAFRKS